MQFRQSLAMPNICRLWYDLQFQHSLRHKTSIAAMKVFNIEIW